MLEQSTSTSADAPPSATIARTGPEASPTRAWERLIAPVRRYVPLAGGIAGIALAYAGELMVESASDDVPGGETPLSLVLYLLGIGVFAVSAWPAWDLLRTQVDVPVEDPALELPKPATRRRLWIVLGAGTGLAVVLNVIALLVLREQLESTPGLYLWLGSMLVLAATGVVARRMEGWAPRWGTGVWPADRRLQVVLVLAVLVILAVASAARLIDLDKLPKGINADEGDRGAVSIQVLRGANTRSIFDNGWYWISMLYFWLLAQVMGVLGIGFAQARVLGALASIISVGVVTWIGIRNFGVRVGLLAGALLSMLAVSIQFARETSEAGPTATLWAVSVACFLEAARRGRSWAWICAGLSGGFSLYFYPTGRLWAVVAAGFCGYLLIHGLGGGTQRRLAILRGSVLAAIAAFIVVGPFLIHSLQVPEVITLRAQETSIFTGDNPTRLRYYKPEWNIVQLLTAQIDRSVGIFNQYHEDGGFWPTDKPIMYGILAVLTLLGIGWVSLRWRDPRYVLLALWFWIGMIGVIVTVETPNLQRLATAVPVLALFPALVLDNMARRVEIIFTGLADRARSALRWATSAAAAAVLLVLVLGEWNAYFVTYAATDRWPQPSILGKIVNDEGTDTLVVTIGREYHQINSGWVRLLAPHTKRGGVEAPGSSLPITVPTGNNLTFLYFHRQDPYIPYIKTLYPGGVLLPRTHPAEGLMFTTYRIAKEQVASLQGATAQPPTGNPVRVDTLGAPPAGLSLTYPAPMRWRAGLRAPRYWNYVFKVGPGPAKLTIDGVKVLEVPPGQAEQQATVSLARGLHAVDFEGTLTAPGAPALFEWAPEPEQSPGDTSKPGPPSNFQTPRPEELAGNITSTNGLLGVAHIEPSGNTGPPIPDQRRIDSTLANCCLSQSTASGGRQYTINWTGSLQAPVTGVYSMTLLAQGVTDLKIDGKSVIHIEEELNEPVGGTVELTAGPHPVEVTYKDKEGASAIEWVWTPPGGETSIVPPWALTPPPNSTVGDRVPQDTLGHGNAQPIDVPPESVP